MNYLISIVVPIYNMGMSIEKCVKSLIKQSYKNIEIILVDDGSNDNSLEVCYKLSKTDRRIRVLHTENRGSGPARNYGISEARGKYVCFPDADDYYEENAVLDMLDAMKIGDNDFIIAGFKSLDTTGAIISEKNYDSKIVNGEEVRKNFHHYIGGEEAFGINGAPWNKMYDLNLIKKYKIEFPSLRRHQDTAFIFQYLTYVKQICFINKTVYVHYLNDLKKEWDKYPLNYIDSVVGLRKIQRTTVFLWNPNNKIVFEKLTKGYISNIIKSMELCISDKFKGKDKIKYIKNILEITNLKNIKQPKCLNYYQRLVLKNISKNNYIQTIILIYLKVMLEKYGVILWIKRVKNL